MKTISLFILMIFSLQLKADIDFTEFGKIPILHEGRIKPINTFARVNLLWFYEKSNLKEMDANEWLAELLFDRESAFKRKVFRIRNIDVTKALNIKHNKDHLFSFYEVSYPLKEVLPTINKLYSIDEKLRTPSQNQIVALYVKILRYYEIARSLSFINEPFMIPLESVAKDLEVDLNKKLSYLDLFKNKEMIFDKAENLKKKDRKKLSKPDILYLILAQQMYKVQSDEYSEIFKVVPPQFSKKEESHWFSPWQTIQLGKGSPQTVQFFKFWNSLKKSYKDQSSNQWNHDISNIQKISNIMGNGVINKTKLNLEANFNKAEYFTKAISLYILSFLLLSFSWLYKGLLFRRISFGCLILGSVPHIVGLTLRCIIMSRPPVSTLYESIISVALVGVVGAIIYERSKKDGIGTFIGTTLGVILLFVSFSYEKGGDSMGMLAAVLNTNFWLATHVVTITIGYGCCFVASVLGHVYLVQTYIKNKNPQKNFDLVGLNKSMKGVTLYALFFTVLGTILGGIWADQSWGRFWGWDPKENGALLICLWLLFILHGRLIGYFKPKMYAAGLIVTGIVVAVAWFGVNLLNVGLHSYGFTDSIAYNLLAFSLIELVFAGTFLFLVLKKNKKDLV